MRLKSLTYQEYVGSPQFWCLEKITYGPRMLVVGKNAAGKSRSINVLASLARNLSGRQPPGQSGEYSAEFDNGEHAYTYEVAYSAGEVQRERIVIGEKEYLSRGVGGFGTIFAEKLETAIDFQLPPNILAATARRDIVQHSFIEPLFEWADSLRYYQFAGIMQAALALFVPGVQAVDIRDQNAVAAIFKEGQKLFGNEFVDSIKKDMALLDYAVDQIDLAPPVTVRFNGFGPQQPVSLYVREAGLSGVTDQFGMSTGMFRVLALLIHVNFAKFKGAVSTVLIDDIGEGLDFDRSCRLIELLRKKSQQHGFQLIMSTNDKFVMNHVPLDEWTVLHREGSTVHVRNNENSKAAFDEFKFTGLSNFSFFEMNAVEMAREVDDEEGRDA
ncbi:AAA family ATPase [Burkholderia vietnamiensis]|uniref:AAA family ATPase n=1 Tax=Burkholderia vietnamiensis TaxID=60552 RepID=UPI002655AB7C|nr:AAA family ATPase [Burkholderia vietnamiensis]MDN7411447.1 AAA family ATPase [Burkholderia vietnamiensis]HEF4837290.1 ATP-binding protein [Burkholderia vietnamiensis]